ncbi:hypothetical protein J2S49_000534 [Arcanobacterium wilhelmae]|uniref:Abi-like protein n=1 Tax=Arcanobacterium wilhelmae TaxID=1803177 RepID=A0ABT9N9T3_9ACTO|nr:Abi family protein [Arcanobacterium wilhelmae]MDP9800458.1 hypothetical protein [Arcanobacterium wilhelmae]WFN89878.1 Abi family protein [Arcanobacterium wilhelmae]
MTNFEEFIPEPRLRPYREAAVGDESQALALYRWSHLMASSCWTVIAHFEVLLRHRIDQVLSEHCSDADTRIPWFFRVDVLKESERKTVATVIDSLRGRNTNPTKKKDQKHGEVDTRYYNGDQLIAGLSFGFWTQLFKTGYEDLFRSVLSRAFLGDGENEDYVTRKQVSSDLESVRQFRNRVAHHDSLVHVPIFDEMERIFRLVRALNPEAERWIRDVSDWEAVFGERPLRRNDTVVVAANVAWDVYVETSKKFGVGFYVVQPGRFFRDVDNLAFYEKQEIHRDVPAILRVVDNVEWTLQNAERRKRSKEKYDPKIGEFIEWTFAEGASYEWPSGRYKIFVLTPAGADDSKRRQGPRHVRLRKKLPHERRGAGSAFTRGWRYVSLDKLKVARDTSDLVARQSDVAADE